MKLSTILNKCDSEKYNEAPREDPALQIETETGWRLSRPRYTRRPAMTYTLGFTDMSQAEKQAIEDAYNDAHGSSESFTWVNRISGRTLTVRFKPQSLPTFRYRGIGGYHRWDISGVIVEEV